MAASVISKPGEKRYITLTTYINKDDSGQDYWPPPESIPDTEKLPHGGHPLKRIRELSIQIISEAYLPVSAEEPGGMGAAAGGPIPSELKLSINLISFFFKLYKLFSQLRNEYLATKRAALHRTVTIIFNLNDLVGAERYLISILPEIQKKLSDEFPVLNFQFSLEGKDITLTSESGVVFTDSLILSLIKKYDKGNFYFAVRKFNIFGMFQIKCETRKLSALQWNSIQRQFFKSTS